MRNTRFLLLVVAALVAPCALEAKTVQANPLLSDARLQSLVEDLQTRLSFPVISRDRDLIVIVAVGGAMTNVRAIARPAVPSTKLAAVLERWAEDTPMASIPVQYQRSGRFTTARIRLNRNRPGQRSSTMVAPIGTLVGTLRSAGFEPHVALQVLNHAAAKPAPQFPHYSRKTSVLYDVSRAPRNYTYVARAALSPWAVPTIAVAGVLMPLITILTELAALIVGLVSRKPTPVRARLYMRLYVYPMYAQALYPFPFLYLVKTRQYLVVGDLWFANPAAGILLGLGTLFGVLLAFPLFLVNGAIAKRVFLPGGVAAAMGLSQEQVKWMRKRRWLARLAFVMGLAVILLTPRQSPFYPYSGPAGILIICLAPWLLSKLFRISKPTLQEHLTEDPDLSERARQIAARAGMALEKISVRGDSFGLATAHAMAQPDGCIVVTRRLLDVLSPEEMDFVIAHELAHLNGGDLTRLGKRVVGLIVSWIPLTVFLLTPTNVREPLWLDVLPAVSVLAFVLQLALLLRMSKRGEYQADRTALETTRNLPAAESALAKLVANTPSPVLHEVDDFSTHPRISRRVLRLRKTAKELGL